MTVAQLDQLLAVLKARGVRSFHCAPGIRWEDANRNVECVAPEMTVEFGPALPEKREVRTMDPAVEAMRRLQDAITPMGSE